MKETNEFPVNGFAILNDIYTTDETDNILRLIEQVNTGKETFRKSAGLFAIRQFLKEVPASLDIIFNKKLKAVLEQLFEKPYFAVKSIYFDKPQQSNWYVSYHQDLTISVDKKVVLEGFNHWTIKQNQFAVQPPLSFLQNIVTVRIHLDDTNEGNGALSVIPASHLKGICRPETIDWSVEKEISCTVVKGGIMLMKPLLLHRSGRTTNEQRRRVIHMEFSCQDLPDELKWAERMELN